MKNTKDKVEKFIRRHGESLFIDSAYCLKSLQHAPQMSTLLVCVQQAFNQGVAPFQLTAQGAYLLRDCHYKPLAIFKPFREQGYQDVLRECIAYRLDHKNIANVPATVITTLQHPVLAGRRLGSCQQVIDLAQTLYDFKQTHLLQAEQIRRLALLDIRLMNMDRHLQNVMVKDRQLYPIDHGCILPQKKVDATCFWMTHPDAMTKANEEEKEYLQGIDVYADVQMLMKEFEQPQHIARRYAVAHFLLQEGIEQGYEIAKIGECFVCKKQLSAYSQVLSDLAVAMENPWEEFVEETKKCLRRFFKGGCLCV